MSLIWTEISTMPNYVCSTRQRKSKIARVTKELDDLDVEIGLMVQELNYLVAKNQASKIIDYAIELNAKCEERENSVNRLEE